LKQPYRNITGSGIRYVIQSLISAAGNLGITAALHEGFSVAEEIAYAVALVCVFAINFLGFRYFVYPGRHRPVAKQLAAFFLSSIGFRLTEYVSFVILIWWIPYQLAIVLILGVSFVTKFVFYRYRVFAPLPQDA